MKIIFTLFAALSLTLISAVKKENTPIAAHSFLQEVITMRISKQVDCKGSDGNTTCFMVQKGASIGKDFWEMLPEPIEGFKYEEGYVYDLTVKIDLVPNRQEGHSRFKYTLINVISKVKIQ